MCIFVHILFIRHFITKDLRFCEVLKKSFILFTYFIHVSDIWQTRTRSDTDHDLDFDLILEKRSLDHSNPTLLTAIAASLWHTCRYSLQTITRKVKAFPYSIPSAGPGADTSVKAVSPQAAISHPPGGKRPLLSARLTVTSPAAEHQRRLAGTKLYCLVTEAHRCEQLA